MAVANMDDGDVVVVVLCAGGVFTPELVNGLTSVRFIYALSCGDKESAFTYFTKVEIKARKERAPDKVSLFVDSSSASAMAKEMRDYNYGVFNPTSGR